MNKILDYIKNYFKTKTVAYYVALGAAFIAFIAGIICSSALGFAGATAVPAVLGTLGLLGFIVSSVFGQDKIGSGLVAFACYGSFIAMFCDVFAHYLAEVQAQAMSGFNIAALQGFSALVTCIVLFLICAVTSNVLAFINQNKTDKKETIKAEAVTDEN